MYVVCCMYTFKDCKSSKRNKDWWKQNKLISIYGHNNRGSMCLRGIKESIYWIILHLCLLIVKYD